MLFPQPFSANPVADRMDIKLLAWGGRTPVPSPFIPGPNRRGHDLCRDSEPETRNL
jgi:hypothetical protein